MLRNFIEITLRHGYFAVNFVKLLKTPFLRSISGWLLLIYLKNDVNGKPQVTNCELRVIVYELSIDALGYLAGPVHQKYLMTFIWGHQFSTWRPCARFFDPSHVPPWVQMYAFGVPSPFAFMISSIWHSPLQFWCCSFAIVT